MERRELVGPGWFYGTLALGSPSRDSTEALVHTLVDREAAARMGRAGAERVRSHFTLQGMVDAYRDLYGALLEGERT